MRPFETMRSLRSPIIDGQHFVHDYLMHSYSMAKQIAEGPLWCRPEARGISRR